jgi:hypothetical protein
MMSDLLRLAQRIESVGYRPHRVWRLYEEVRSFGKPGSVYLAERTRKPRNRTKNTPRYGVCRNCGNNLSIGYTCRKCGENNRRGEDLV